MPLDWISVVLTQNQSRPVYHNVCLLILSVFFALLKILEMNEIGVYECVIVYPDVLKVCYIFLDVAVC